MSVVALYPCAFASGTRYFCYAVSAITSIETHGEVEQPGPRFGDGRLVHAIQRPSEPQQRPCGRVESVAGVEPCATNDRDPHRLGRRAMWEGIAGELHRDNGLELVEAPDRQGLVLLVEREDIVLALLLRDAEPAPLGQRQSWPPQ